MVQRNVVLCSLRDVDYAYTFPVVSLLGSVNGIYVGTNLEMSKRYLRITLLRIDYILHLWNPKKRLKLEFNK